MELTTLADVIARIDISELGSGYDQEDLDEMTLRDLRAIAALPASSNIPAPKTALVIEAIKANPMAGDREIARLVGCSAMTVGRTRAKLGAKLDVRNFTRGGKVYTMRERRRNEKPLAGSADIGGTIRAPDGLMGVSGRARSSHKRDKTAGIYLVKYSASA